MLQSSSYSLFNQPMGIIDYNVSTDARLNQLLRYCYVSFINTEGEREIQRLGMIIS